MNDCISYYSDGSNFEGIQDNISGRVINWVLFLQQSPTEKQEKTIKMYEEILNFWFGKPDSLEYGKQRKEWFTKNSAFDEEIRSRFLSIYQQGAAGKLENWRGQPLSCLALILLLDQFPRNMFRGQAQSFATDERALSYAQYAISKEFDKALLPVQRWFMYLPFEHSENIDNQHRNSELWSTLKDDPDSARSIEYAYHHLEVIERFGRFPHRNQILGRPNTLEEEEFLKQPDSSF